MRHIHISSVSMHLATRGNNKILRTPPPHISSSEEILPRLTRRTLAQLRTNKLPFLKSYLHKVDGKSHPSRLCSLCNTHTQDTHHLFNCTHIRATVSPLDLRTDPTGVTPISIKLLLAIQQVVPGAYYNPLYDIHQLVLYFITSHYFKQLLSIYVIISFSRVNKSHQETLLYYLCHLNHSL